MTNGDGKPEGDAQEAPAPAEAEGVQAQDPVMGQLKALYDDVASEPLPDDLMKLLDKLDQVERTR